MTIAVWNLSPLVALLILAPAPVAKGATLSSQSVVEKTKEGAEKTKDGLSKTGEVMTDGWITTRVHERFVSDDLLKDSDISVSTENHVVTLKGTVMGQAGRAKATTIARRTEGVRRVVNQLTIGPKRTN